MAERAFPVGARVLVDGRDEAIVAQVFPQGSTSLLAPHYCVRFVGGSLHEQVRVGWARVGVDRKYGRVVAPDPVGRCGACGFANFRYGERAADGTRGYRCVNCGDIKAERKHG